MPTHTYTYIYIYIYTCVCIHIYIYIYDYGTRHFFSVLEKQPLVTHILKLTEDKDLTFPPPASSGEAAMADLRPKILHFRGFDSSIIFV